MKWLWNGIANSMDALVAPSFGWPGYEARAKTWTEPVAPDDLSGRHFIVTGANSGIGFAATRMLAERSATVHMVCRNQSRGQEALQDVESTTGNDNLHLHLADLADLQSVSDFADAYLRDDFPLHGLIHNAGALVHERKIGPQDLELTFAVHVVSPVLLTRALLDRITTHATREQRGRIVFVSSGGMYTQQLNLKMLSEGPRDFDGVVAYANCKRAQVILAHEYAERFDDRPLAFASMHPGWVETPGVSAALPTFQKLTKSILRTPEQGADTMVWLAASPGANDAHGEFYLDREARREHIPMRDTESPREDVEQLWDKLMELTEPFVPA